MEQTLLILFITLIVGGVLFTLTEWAEREYDLIILELLMSVFGTVFIVTAICIMIIGIGWLVNRMSL
jgi:hypothetical protein